MRPAFLPAKIRTLAIAAGLATVLTAAGQTAALARDWDDDGDGGWRRHEWREHEWREHHPAYYGYYGYAPGYYVYREPAPSMEFGFNFR